MIEIIMGYMLIGVGIVIPVALLAGFIFVLLRPLDLDEVKRRHEDAHAEVDQPTPDTRADSTPTPPGRPRRVA